MTFEYSASSIWLVDLPSGSDGHGGYAMCERHAGRLTPPIGWRLHDNRDIAMTLFSLIEYSSENASQNAELDSDVA
jgi:hypothetical protein